MKNFASTAKWGMYSIVSIIIISAVFVIFANSANTKPATDNNMSSHNELIQQEAEAKTPEPLQTDELAESSSKPKSVSNAKSSPQPEPVEDEKMIIASSDRPVSQSSTSEDSEHPPTPDFTLQTLEGKDFNLNENLGKLTILNFWATWCKPCVHEIPYFVELYDQYKDDGLQIIGISLDEGRSRTRLEPTVEKLDINYPVLADGRSAAMLYGGIRSIPTTFIINEEGNVLGQIKGARPKEFFEGIVKKEMLGE